MSGDYAQRADIVSLAVTTGNPSDARPAQEDFLRLSRVCSTLSISLNAPG